MAGQDMARDGRFRRTNLEIVADDVRDVVQVLAGWVRGDLKTSDFVRICEKVHGHHASHGQSGTVSVQARQARQMLLKAVLGPGRLKSSLRRLAAEMGRHGTGNGLSAGSELQAWAAFGEALERYVNNGETREFHTVMNLHPVMASEAVEEGASFLAVVFSRLSVAVAKLPKRRRKAVASTVSMALAS